MIREALREFRNFLAAPESIKKLNWQATKARAAAGKSGGWRERRSNERYGKEEGEARRCVRLKPSGTTEAHRRLKIKEVEGAARRTKKRAAM